MSNLLNTLEEYVQRAIHAKRTFVGSKHLEKKIEFVCRNIRIKAPIRFLLSCCAAKIDNSKIDIRKPYTEIRDKDAYSGRTYDEQYIQKVIEKHNLPCNTTTAYLTPAFRNRNSTMTPKTELVGRQPELYKAALELIDEVHKGNLSAEKLFKETIRILVIIREENAKRIKQLIETLKGSDKSIALSSEQIVNLLQQHLACKNSSRLPILIVAAAYNSVSDLIGEKINDLQAHNAADKQTGAYGDVEVTLINDDNIVTSYEMKEKRITKSDIEIAIKKIAESKLNIDNYIFITTEEIDFEVSEYAKSIYDLSKFEIAILDCIGFIKHFLHFFHRKRTAFIEEYQKLVLDEPNSAVNQPLKEAFLALRQAAEVEK
ncbi:MAG: restriction endonuclease, SacI family [Candidatus Scalinduaceae bacterium]